MSWSSVVALEEALRQAIVQRGWRKVVVGASEESVAALEEWLSRCGRGFVSDPKQIDDDLCALGERKVIIMIAPKSTIGDKT